MILSYKIFESLMAPKSGDVIVCVGNINDLKTHNHIGILRDNGIEFLNRFSDKLHNLRGEINSKNGWYLSDPSRVKPFNDNASIKNLPVFYSQNFKNILSYNLKFLLDYERIYFSDVSFIDKTNRNDTVSFLSKRNFDKLENKNDVWKTSMRQNMRIGRFIKKIVPDDNDELIQDYTNEYKFSYNLNENYLCDFKIYKGIDMAKWFWEVNYAYGGGSLHGSCMKHVKSQKRLPLYTDNPDKVRMLVIKNRDNKLLGRALLWKLDEPKGKIYMDRIYSADDYIDKLFIDYANKKGYLNRFDVDKNNITMIVNVRRNFGPPQYNPYMDTFKFFVKNGNYLTNRFKNFRTGEYYEYIDHD